MPDPQPVPINAKFDDDFVTQLIVVLNTDTMREVAAKVVAGALNHFTPMRYPAHAFQMMQVYLGQIAQSSYITR